MFLGKSENAAGPEISKIRTPEKKPLESKQVGFSCLGFWFGLFVYLLGIWVVLFVFSYSLLKNLVITEMFLFVFLSMQICNTFYSSFVG